VEVKFNAMKGLEAIRVRPSGRVDSCIENLLSYGGALCRLLAVYFEPAFMYSYFLQHVLRLIFKKKKKNERRALVYISLG
jgi:hypothetical protein